MSSPDLSHFLLPSSRLAPDVVFLVGQEGEWVPAHRGILATALHAFDRMFFGPDSSTASEVTVEEVDPGSFRLFLQHVYGKRMELEADPDFTTLAQLFRLAKQYGANVLMEEVVGRMRGQLARENTYTGLSKLGDLLALHGVEELQEDCVKKIHSIEVDEENFASFMNLAGDQHNNRQQALQQSLGEFLGRACPSSGQLASFLSAREDLDIDTVISVIKFIPKDKTKMGVVKGKQKVEVVEVREIKTEVGLGEEKQEEVVDVREMLRDFLQFAQFPELTREELVEGFLKRSVKT